MENIHIPYHIIDMDQYPRKSHFDYFRSMSYPYVGVTVNVDVTELKTFSREKGCSFYLLFMHAVALAADSVPELRRRIHNGGIIEFDQCGTSHTEALDDGTYRYCTLYHHMPLEEYLNEAEKRRNECRSKKGLCEDGNADSLYFISSLPWLHYSSLIQPVAGRDESNPRITWGKYEQDAAGRLIMPVTILCHHALVDGRHLGAFFERLSVELHTITG